MKTFLKNFYLNNNKKIYKEIFVFNKKKIKIIQNFKKKIYLTSLIPSRKKYFPFKIKKLLLNCGSLYFRIFINILYVRKTKKNIKTETNKKYIKKKILTYLESDHIKKYFSINKYFNFYKSFDHNFKKLDFGYTTSSFIRLFLEKTKINISQINFYYLDIYNYHYQTVYEKPEDIFEINFRYKKLYGDDLSNEKYLKEKKNFYKKIDFSNFIRIYDLYSLKNTLKINNLFHTTPYIIASSENSLESWLKWYSYENRFFTYGEKFIIYKYFFKRY